MTSYPTDPDLIIAAKRAEARSMNLLREMTTNLMRITRGAGNPTQVFRLADDYTEAAQRYRDITGFGFDMNIITEALSIPGPKIKDDASWFTRDSYHAYELAISGALQVAASRLSGDHLREAKGKDEMQRAFEIWKNRGDAR